MQEGINNWILQPTSYVVDHLRTYLEKIETHMEKFQIKGNPIDDAN